MHVFNKVWKLFTVEGTCVPSAPVVPTGSVAVNPLYSWKVYIYGIVVIVTEF